MSGVPTPDQILPKFRDTLSGDNESIAAASQYLRTFVRLHMSIPVLFQILATANESELAGVLLRRPIAEHWMRLDANTKEELKMALLAQITKEPIRKVRRTIAYLLAAMARIVLTSNERWDKLVSAMFELLNSNSIEMVETAWIVLENLFSSEPVAAQLASILDPLRGVIIRCFDPKQPVLVQTGAIQCLISLVPSLKVKTPAFNSYKALFPGILAAIESMIRREHFTEAADCLALFEEFIECPVPYLSGHVPLLVKFVCALSSTTNVEIPLRQSAISVLYWLVQYKPKSIQKNNLTDMVVDLCFRLMAEPDEFAENPDDDDEFELTPHQMGANLLGKSSVHLPAQLIYSKSLPYLDRGFSSSNGYEVRAAFGALAMMAKGCAGVFVDNLKVYVDALITGMTDSRFMIKRCACIALGQFSEYLQPEILDYYEIIIPAIYNVMGNSSANIQEYACYSLVSLVEKLDDRIAPMADRIMQRLLEILKGTNKPSIQEMAISAISSVAGSLGPLFAPYAKIVIEEIAVPLVSIDKPHMAELRGRATEMAGVIAAAIGKDAFSSYLQFFFQHAMQGVTTAGFEDCREFTYNFFGHLSSCLGEDFASCLGDVMPVILTGMMNDEGIRLDSSDASMSGLIGDDINDDGIVKKYIVSNSLVEEKVSVLKALTVIAYSTKARFLDHLTKTFEILHVLLTYVHPDIRQAALEPAIAFVSVLNSAHPVPGSVSADTRNYIGVLMPIFMSAIMKDHSPEVVAETYKSLTQLLKLVGLVAFEGYEQTIAQVVLRTLQKKIYCLEVSKDIDEDEDEYDEDEETLQLEFDVLSNCMRMVNTFASYYNERIFQFWPWLDAVRIHLNSKRDVAMREEASGFFAELVERGLKEKVDSKFDWFVSQSSTAMGDENAAVASNGVYLFGLLVQYSPNKGEKLLHEFISKCKRISQTFSDDYHLLDNVAGACARVIMFAPANSYSLRNYLDLIFSIAPLKEDHKEFDTVYSVLLKLYAEENPSIARFIPNLLGSLAHALTQSGLPSELGIKLVQGIKLVRLISSLPLLLIETLLIQQMLERHGEQLRPVVESMAPNLQSVIQKALQTA